jgi:hypothetical protein|tara:strand:+ start:3253 stop:3648 length:396 start_codon:yes stop_codon:yes gene_type:complete
MAVTLSNVANPLGTILVTDLNANGTAEEDTTTGGGTMYSVQINNSDATAITYVKISDSTMGSTVSGTQIPDYVFFAAAGSTVTYAFPDGLAYANGLSFWATSVKASQITNGGNAVAQTDPIGTVVVKILAT